MNTYESTLGDESKILYYWDKTGFCLFSFNTVNEATIATLSVPVKYLFYSNCTGNHQIRPQSLLAFINHEEYLNTSFQEKQKNT